MTKETICPDCGRTIERSFEYCPWCGISVCSYSASDHLSAVFSKIETQIFEHTYSRIEKMECDLGEIEKEMDRILS